MDLSGPLRDMPECWKDEKRMNSLFAPFRKKELNPVDWESKMKFWHTLIEKWCLEKHRASFSVRIIQSEFKRNGRTPVSIETAVQELIRVGEVRNKAEFLATDPSQSWTSWAVDSFIKAPVGWSLSKLRSYVTTDSDTLQPDTEFVHLSFLKERGERVCSEWEKRDCGDLVSYGDVAEMISTDKEPPVSEDTVHCVLHYLCLQHLASVHTVGDTKVVKLAKRGSKLESRELSQADMAIFKLEQNKAVLELNIQHLELEKERCVEEARANLAKGLERTAKSCLRRKKQLEKCIEKRSVALDNLESLLASLRNTASDSKVLDAYKVGLSALKGTLKSSGLSEDGVFETMAQLQDMNDIQDEIQQAMSQPIGTVGEEDLDQELADILADPHNKSIELPSVPTHGLDLPMPDSSVSASDRTERVPRLPQTLPAS